MKFSLPVFPDHLFRHIIDLTIRNIFLIYFGSALMLSLFISPNMVNAEDNSVDAYYVAKEGDSLWNIAQRFRVSYQDMVNFNVISNENLVNVGKPIFLPGIFNYIGEVDTVEVGFGWTLTDLSRQYGTSRELITNLNRLASPDEIYLGYNLILPAENVSSDDILSNSSDTTPITPPEKLFLDGINRWHVVNLTEGDGFINSLTIYKYSSIAQIKPRLNVEVSAGNTTQGKTISLMVRDELANNYAGSFLEKTLTFHHGTDDYFFTIAGVHALQDPGFYPLRISADVGLHEVEQFQYVFIQDGSYPYDPSLQVADETTEMEINAKESEEWFSFMVDISPQKLWTGIFKLPITELLADCIPSTFGNRRSYNGSAYAFFHTGLDYCGSIGREIYAPANGIVAFSGNTVVRGGATIIDHGWGVYSGYAHQSDIFVQEGDIVEAGQVIGLVGASGRVTGPHLHWEIIVNGVQVDPMQWLNVEFP